MSFMCPRRVESSHPSARLTKRDDWVPSHLDATLHACSYCGSLDPTETLDGIESRRFQVCTTGKNYKMYLAPLHAKFYFQHFSTAQRHRFLEIYNERRNDDFFQTVQVGDRSVPLGFSVPPFFARVDKP